MLSIFDLTLPPSPFFATNGKREVADANGDPILWLDPGASGELLYTQDIFAMPPAEVVAPILAPDGHHLISLSEWLTAHGEATTTCLPQGTRYQFKFRGLIPNGVYTIWHFTFFDFSGGALASHPPDDINNVFVASDTGGADFSLIATPGPATFFGARPACTLTPPTEEFFVALYRIDSNTCGSFPCNDPFAPNEVAHLYFRR